MTPICYVMYRSFVWRAVLKNWGVRYELYLKLRVLWIDRNRNEIHWTTFSIYPPTQYKISRDEDCK